MVVWFSHWAIGGGSAKSTSAFNTEIAENPEIAEKRFRVGLEHF